MRFVTHFSCNRQLKPRSDSEVACVREASIGITVTKVAVEVGAVLNCPIKEERCLASGLLDRKREIALHIDGST